MGGETPGRGDIPAWPAVPLPGDLVPFQVRDARFFYGRDELATQLVRWSVARLDGDRDALVAGESGPGKSSLLRAGLMPRLAAGVLGPGSQWWPRRVIRLTGSPLFALALALAQIAGAGGRGGTRRLSRPFIAYPPLKAALEAGPLMVGPMSEAELRHVITGPAAETDIAVAAARPRRRSANCAKRPRRAGAAARYR